MSEEVSKVLNDYENIIGLCAERKSEIYDRLEILSKQDLIYYIIEQFMIKIQEDKT